MKKVLFLGLCLLLLGCATEPVEQQLGKPVEVIIGTKPTVEKQPIVYEVTHDLSPQQWIIASAGARNAQNEVYIHNQAVRDEQLRADIKKSKNWHTDVDGRSVSGYDVIRDMKGEFDDFPTTKKVEKYYYHVASYDYDGIPIN